MLSLFKLTKENYFSPEAEKLYLGSSSFKAWDKYHEGGCESREVAKSKGIWTDKENSAFLLGSYVHAWSEGRLNQFIMEHPELFKKDGTLLAKYALGDKMIETIKKDPVMMQLIDGQKEKFFTGKLFGVDFKIQVDVLNIERGFFTDIKTTKNIYEKYWNSETREYESFIQKYDYLLQFAIYGEILRQNLDMDNYLNCFIAVVDKQETPDHNAIFMDLDGFIKEKLQEIEFKLPHIMAVRNGEIEPERCERCEYCRSTKKITKPIHWLDLGSELR